ncbi:MAG: ATP-binding protein [Clostridiaceae bacterium]|jgi:hypothetical protein|nr:ATP-binding protein [Clostridiaceae bacterium]
MAQRGRTKKVFPGGNTSKGFYSFYDQIIPEDAERIFVIKGGPGVGKSNFMRTIGEEFLKLGYDVEQHYCSSDNKSLDGLVIKKANVALLDGTAPHVVDPKNPGAVDEILNLGEYWNDSGLVKDKYYIINCNKQIKMRFNSAYRYLKAAKEMQDDMETIIGEGVDREKLNKLKTELRYELVDGVNIISRSAGARHLFDSAITPDGLVDYVDTIVQSNYICYYLKAGIGTVSTEILAYLAGEYNIKGYDVELYHQPLNPDRLQTLVVEDLKIAITINPRMEAKAYKIVDLDTVIDESKYMDKAELLKKDAEIYARMLEEGVGRIKMAKLIHDDMEKSYIGSMDFGSVTELRNKTIERIKTILQSR